MPLVNHNHYSSQGFPQRPSLTKIQGLRHAECNTSHQSKMDKARRAWMECRVREMSNNFRWEYKTVIECNPEEIHRQVERWGMAGWELISVVASGEQLAAFMKRAARPSPRPAVNPIGLRKF
jgi:hypothetical protein